MRDLAIRSFAIIISLLALLVVLEVGVRVFQLFYPVYKLHDPEIGFRYVPDVSLVHFDEESQRDIQTDINQEGFRDVDHTKPKPPGINRVAVLGVSFVAATQVQFPDVFHQQLQRNLNSESQAGWQVLNFGVSGYSTAQSFQVYLDYADGYDPDVVVLCLFLGNDIGDNSPELSRKGRIFHSLDANANLAMTPNITEDLYAGWLSRSALYRALMRRLDRLKRKYVYYPGDRQFMHRYNGFLENPPREWSQAWHLQKHCWWHYGERLNPAVTGLY